VIADAAATLRLDIRQAQGIDHSKAFRAIDGESKSGADVSGGVWRERKAPWVGADVVAWLRP
jgi:hypothetical protein